MNRISIRQTLLEDIDGFHSCLDSIARERKYLGFTTAPSLEETRTSLVNLPNVVPTISRQIRHVGVQTGGVRYL